MTLRVRRLDLFMFNTCFGLGRFDSSVNYRCQRCTTRVRRSPADTQHRRLRFGSPMPSAESFSAVAAQASRTWIPASRFTGRAAKSVLSRLMLVDSLRLLAQFIYTLIVNLLSFFGLQYTLNNSIHALQRLSYCPDLFVIFENLRSLEGPPANAMPQNR